MIPNPFGAKIEIFGGGSIKATLELERIAEAKREEEKEEQNEQTIRGSVRNLLNIYVIPADVLSQLVLNPEQGIIEAEIEDYELTIMDVDYGKLEGTVQLEATASPEPVEDGEEESFYYELHMDLSDTTFSYTTPENKNVQKIYQLEIQSSKQYGYSDGASINSNKPEDNLITIL